MNIGIAERLRDLLGRLAAHGLIAPGPREPRRGAPRTWVTTDRFLAAFGLATLADLPDPLPDPGEGGAGEAGPAEGRSPSP